MYMNLILRLQVLQENSGILLTDWGELMARPARDVIF